MPKATPSSTNRPMFCKDHEEGHSNELKLKQVKHLETLTIGAMEVHGHISALTLPTVQKMVLMSILLSQHV